MVQPLLVNDLVVTQAICYAPNTQQISVANRYWRVSSIVLPGAVMDLELANQVSFGTAGRWTALIYNGANYNGTRARIFLRGLVDPRFLWQISTVGAGGGTAGAVALPTQTAGLATFLTGFIGKQGEGRTYAPFPAAADNITDGIPRAGYTTALKSLANFYTNQQTITGGSGGSILIDPIIFPKGNPALYKVIEANRVLAEWATQKRRGAYGRFNKPPF